MPSSRNASVWHILYAHIHTYDFTPLKHCNTETNAVLAQTCEGVSINVSSQCDATVHVLYSKPLTASALKSRCILPGIVSSLRTTDTQMSRSYHCCVGRGWCNIHVHGCKGTAAAVSHVPRFDEVQRLVWEKAISPNVKMRVSQMFAYDN